MSVSLIEVKQLRERTGAGLGTCKEALKKANGNLEKAMDEIRKKGIAKAEKRQGKSTSNGVIGVYEHGVDNVLVSLVEVNCETDFVARHPDFKAFAHNIAMQVAAMKPKYLSKEDISKKSLAKERNLWRDEFISQGKPEKIVDNIVDGKIESYYKEVCLMDQIYFKEEERTIKDLLHELIAKFGEKIVIKRFIVWQVGE